MSKEELKGTEEIKEEETKEETKEEVREPVSFTIEKAKKEISIAAINAQRKYGLPSYIVALIMEAVLADVRAGKTVDMVMDFEQYKGALKNE